MSPGPEEEAGEALVRHAHVDLIAITGSTETGKRIMRIAADSLKKVNLEMSSIDPFIVCEDADLDVAAPARSGRAISTPARCAPRPSVSMSSSVADAFIEPLWSSRQVKVGDPRARDRHGAAHLEPGPGVGEAVD